MVTTCIVRWFVGTRTKAWAVHLYTKEVAYQKLDYTHYNPCTDRWKLVSDPCDYIYSSAKFYMLGQKQYSFLKDLREEF